MKKNIRNSEASFLKVPVTYWAKAIFEYQNLKNRGAGSDTLTNQFCVFSWKFYCKITKNFETHI